MSAARAGYTLDTIPFVTREGTALLGDLYRPAGDTPAPALVAVHGGGWKAGDRGFYRHLGPWLAERGVAVFAIDYRLADPKGGGAYPAAVHDVRAAVQFLRREAGRLGVDGARLGLIGDSAGAHLSALVALAGGRAPFCDDDAFAGTDASVKAVVGVYGVYDLVAQWRHDQLVRPRDHITEIFLGASAIEDRMLYQHASPINHVSIADNRTAFLLAWGTQDDVVDPQTQSAPFLEALKQATYFVRTVIVPDAPHFWIGDPLDEPGSHAGFLAPRLLRFLTDRL